MSVLMSAIFFALKNAALVSFSGFANLGPENNITIKDVGKGRPRDGPQG